MNNRFPSKNHLGTPFFPSLWAGLCVLPLSAMAPKDSLSPPGPAAGPKSMMVADSLKVLDPLTQALDSARGKEAPALRGKPAGGRKPTGRPVIYSRDSLPKAPWIKIQPPVQDPKRHPIK